MVGNSNTRWHWGSADQSPEPAIPWDAWLFPDGTPISFTEAGALREYVTGVKEFVAFEDFMPANISDGDYYQTVSAGEIYRLGNGDDLSVDEGLFEATLWADGAGDGVFSMIVLAERSSEGTNTEAPEASGQPGQCGVTDISNDTDIPGTTGYRTLDLTNETKEREMCINACCAWESCTAWVVRQLEPGEDDQSCKYASGTRTCCWVKSMSTGARSKRIGTTSGRVIRPPLPPGPTAPRINGYHITINATTKALTISRSFEGSDQQLGEFDLTSLENGLVLDAWNMVRVVVTKEHTGARRFRVFFNPMFHETGFHGNSSDALLTPVALPPRLDVTDAHPLEAGGVAIASSARQTRIDYISVLPLASTNYM